jgi:hypothetical protein
MAEYGGGLEASTPGARGVSQLSRGPMERCVGQVTQYGFSG